MAVATCRATTPWFAILVIAFLCAPDAAAQRPQLTPSVADVAYGDHPRQILDVYLAESDTPAPVLIYFHGGGFVKGDKVRLARDRLAQRCLAAGISVVSANYRFIVDRPGEPGFPYPAPMHDAARVVQFVRSRAQEWNIDPRRVGLSGGSAGACMAIWLAVQDDLADPESEDPVARQSTRVSCVYCSGGPTTLDPRIILSTIGGSPQIHSSIPLLFGVESIEELERPEVRKLVEEASALNHVSADDPPLYLRYGLPIAGTPLPADTRASISIHHPMFGKLMRDRYEALGLECVVLCKDLPADVSIFGFLCDKLGVEEPAQPNREAR